MTRRAVVVLGALALLAGCVTASYRRTRIGEPVPPGAEDGVVPGQDLGAALAALGAPSLVWASENGDVVVAWTWLDAAGLDFGVRYSFERFVTASFDWASLRREIDAVVMIFDAELRLLDVRRGKLGELIPEAPESDSGWETLRAARGG